MWVFTRDGFFAAISRECEKDEIVIKAKYKADLLKLLQVIDVRKTIHETPETECPFYIVLKKSQWMYYLNEYVQDIDYDTVLKNIVSNTDAARQKAYHTVWSTMYNWLGRESFHQDDI